jgi:heme/copper-type cytochrome/quinol oxidase subunit 2
MLPPEDLLEGEPRYLETDNRVVFPLLNKIRCFVGREDVIHALTLPPAGLKIDATPGRLSVVNLNFEKRGVLLGQCRELCGANHRLMPIVVETTSSTLFKE